MKGSYLENDLSPQEIAYLTKIVVNAKIDYIRRYNKNENEYIELETVNLQDKKTFEEQVFRDFDMLFKAGNLKYILSDEILCKALEILTKKERLVFFSFYCEKKTTVEIADELNLDRSRVSHIKEDAKAKVRKKYQELKGINENE